MISSLEVHSLEKFYVIIHYLLHAVPIPAIHSSPGGNRTVYYSGENFNVTCTSISGATIIWSSQLSPFTNTSIGSNASVLIFQPIKVSSATSRSMICGAHFPGNINILGSFLSSLNINIAGMFNLFMHLCPFYSIYFQFHH